MKPNAHRIKMNSKYLVNKKKNYKIIYHLIRKRIKLFIIIEIISMLLNIVNGKIYIIL